MKWSLLFEEKMKAAIILVILMVAIIVSNLFVRKLTKNHDLIIASIFDDRLQPSVDLYEMSTLSEQRMVVLSDYFASKNYLNNEDIFIKLKNIEYKFDLLLFKYQKTYLVKEEKQVLSDLKVQLANLNLIVDKNKHDLVQAGFILQARDMTDLINKNIGNLIRLQSEVGKELLTQYKTDTYYIIFFNTFQILLSIIIGVIILKMISASVILNKYDHKINLN